MWLHGTSKALISYAKLTTMQTTRIWSHEAYPSPAILVPRAAGQQERSQGRIQGRPGQTQSDMPYTSKNRLGH